MRILYSKGFRQMFWLSVCVFGSILLGSLCSKNLKSLWMIPIICIFGFLLCVLICINGERRHWIGYGENKVVIHRFSKDIKANDWSPQGKWQNRVDKVELQELVRYGYTWDLLKKHLEFHHYRSGVYAFDNEVFFELKNGKQIPVELAYYTVKEQRELFQYIFRTTGILPSGVLLKTYHDK